MVLLLLCNTHSVVNILIGVLLLPSSLLRRCSDEESLGDYILMFSVLNVISFPPCQRYPGRRRRRKMPGDQRELLLGYLICFLLCYSLAGKKPLNTFFATFNLMRNFLEGPQIFFGFSRFAFAALQRTHTNTRHRGIGICRSQGKPRGKNIFAAFYKYLIIFSLYTSG